MRKNSIYRDSNSRSNVSEGSEVTSELCIPGRPVHTCEWSVEVYNTIESYRYLSNYLVVQNNEKGDTYYSESDDTTLLIPGSWLILNHV